MHTNAGCFLCEVYILLREPAVQAEAGCHSYRACRPLRESASQTKAGYSCGRVSGRGSVQASGLGEVRSQEDTGAGQMVLARLTDSDRFCA